MTKHKYPNVGQIITPCKPVPAYGHRYIRMSDGELMNCILQPGEHAIVKQSKCVAVRGPRPYFTLVQFERFGQMQSAAVWPGEYLVVGHSQEGFPACELVEEDLSIRKP